MTQKLYYEDTYAREFDAEVISHDGNKLILNQTLFYPGGGGQPCDLGTINGIEVLEVIEQGEEIIHIMKEEIHDKNVHGILDWDRRFELMQQHLGEHLFAGSLWTLHHLHTDRMRIEGDNVSIDTDKPADMKAILEAEHAANESVWKNIPVEVIYPDMAEVREHARKLPPENAVMPIRIIKVEGVDYVPCCGLHVSSTGQAGLVKITSCENHKGGSRIYLKCGRAAYRWLDSLYAEVRKAESELVCGYEGINEKILILKSQIHDLKAHNDSTIDRLMKPIADNLIQNAKDRIITHIMHGSSQEEIKHLFKLLTNENNGIISLLAGVNASGVFIIFGTHKENKNIDVRPAFKKAIEILNGKGGGSSFCAQGHGKNYEALNDALNTAVSVIKI